eukprot:maker-scaffold129_size324999-snap-gene-1.25 protein:Tk10960 transcript:maker-scaffold129_size324999-snap-gene-1.25-mRNA-1 annotation:"activating transcription factor 1"
MGDDGGEAGNTARRVVDTLLREASFAHHGATIPANLGLEKIPGQWPCFSDGARLAASGKSSGGKCTSPQDHPIELTSRRRRAKFAEDEEVPSEARYFLKRRLSYRKIFNDLGGSNKMIQEDRSEAISGSESSASEDLNSTTVSSSTPLSNLSTVSSGIPGNYNTISQGLSHSPSSGHMTLGSNDPHQTFAPMSGNHLSSGPHHSGMRSPSANSHVIQYSHQDGNSFLLPTALTNHGLHGMSPLNGSHSPNLLPPHSHGGHSVHSDNPDSNNKREMRLMKNREAARECRRKKKEYIKCLENRVAVLETQNKALIEELKSLKELYTGTKQS